MISKVWNIYVTGNWSYLNNVYYIIIIQAGAKLLVTVIKVT